MMTPVLTLPMAQFSSPGLKTAFDVLGAGNAMMVGGCVRAAVLGDARAYLDIDIATTLLPQDVMRRFEDAGIRAVPTGIDHGTVTVIPGPQAFEITTLRRDVETDGRRAVVAFTESWEEDAQRRDFTMNTLLMDMDGHVFDPTGQGVADLRTGVVRFVGDADTRIKEDALRILRFFRFHARYGKGAADVTGYQACVHNRSLLKTLSRERVTDEVLKLLLAPRAGAAISAMREGNILEGLWQKDWSENAFGLLQSVAVKLEVEHLDLVLLMYCMKPENADVLDQVCAEFFVLSNRQKKFLHDVLSCILKPAETVKQTVYKYGRDVVVAATLLSNVFKSSIPDPAALEGAGINVLRAPLLRLPVNARELMLMLNLSEGKDLGNVLKKVESWWLESDGVVDMQQCVDYARQLIKTGM